jgi:very-short-patch-repair endonuclease
MPKVKNEDVKLKCQFCNKIFIVKYGLRHRKFCSNKCRGKAQYELQRNTNSCYNGSHSWIKGKTFEDVYGIEKANEIKEILRQSKIGNNNPAKRKEVKEKISKAFEKKRDEGWVSPLRGRKHTEEQNKETSRTTKIAMNKPEMREKLAKVDMSNKMKEWHSVPENKEKFLKAFQKEETREKMRNSHSRAIAAGKYKNKKDTNIEKFIEGILIQNGWIEEVDYFKQFAFPVENPKYVLDFYVPAFRLGIEAMGCWWHKCEKCGYGPLREQDKKRTEFITSNGINIYNIWGHDIKKYTILDFRYFLIEILIPNVFV